VYGNQLQIYHHRIASVEPSCYKWLVTYLVKVYLTVKIICKKINVLNMENTLFEEITAKNEDFLN